METATKTKSRGQRIWERVRPLRDTNPISIERAKIITRAYREAEGLPLYLKRGYAIEKVMEQMPIFIDDEQLLVGDFSGIPMSPELFPELTVQWVADYLATGQGYRFEEGAEDDLKEICDFWMERSELQTFNKTIGAEKLASLNELNEDGAWIFAAATEAQTEKGWNIPDYARAITLGTSGLVSQIDEALETLQLDSCEAYKSRSFLLGLKRMLNAAVIYAHRYAQLCREMAETAAEPRRSELLQMAEICMRVPEFPARTFHEAVQSMYFFHLMAYYDSRTVGLGFGRVDQFLYPYYKQDTDSGILDDELATQILECFRVKIMSKRNVFSVTVGAALSNESHFHNCTIGGQDDRGRDAVNRLSYLWLDAAERCRTPHPTLSVRWHPNMDPEFILRAIEVVKCGMGFPAWFNDEPTIEYLLARGVSLEEARDYAVGGCVLHNVVGKTPTTWPSVINFAKIFEVAIHNGIDTRTGKRVGPETGYLKDFKSMDEIKEAFYTASKYFIDRSINYVNEVSLFREDVLPETFVSCMFDDCIKKGRSILSGGARYPINCMYVLPVGVVDIGNSFAALQKCVFEDHSITLEELQEAIDHNFEGYEDVYAAVSAVPKFGNDEPYVDYIVNDLYHWMCGVVHEFKGTYGTRYEVAPHSIAFHANMGLRVGALPSGRLAKTSLADGAVSPTQGTDENGPSAVVNSAGHIDHVDIFGTLFNMRFMPSALKDRSDHQKLAALIRTYFNDYKGKHIQFNVVDQAVLLDAKAHPENHKDLIVRVAGYSALWVELPEAVHDELIRRTANEL